MNEKGNKIIEQAQEEQLSDEEKHIDKKRREDIEANRLEEHENENEKKELGNRNKEEYIADQQD